jgi:tripartite-type tricarboxylate transporter receptor subunit TctC
MTLSFPATCGCLIAAIAYGSGLWAQEYPSKPIRIVTGSTGSGGDFVTRIVAQEMHRVVGENAIVDNRGGVTSGTVAAKAPPDGYTLILQSSTLWISALMQPTPFDPVKDFVPITLVAKSPSVLIVHPSVPANSVRELIALAKGKPNALNYSSGSAGGSSHLAAELFKAMAGVKIVRVAYKSSSMQMADLISGYVQMNFDRASLLMPLVKAGKLKALAVTSAEPSKLVPGLPPIAATVPGYESAGTFGLLAPAGTPHAVVSRLNNAVAQILSAPDVREKFAHGGMETVGNASEQFSAMIKSEMTRLDKVIKDNHIVAE